MISNFLKKILYRSMLLCFIFLLLYFAIQSIEKFFSVKINSERPQIEKELSILLDQPIKIGNINLKWVGLIPTVQLKQIQFFNKGNGKPSFYLGYLNMTPAIWESLTQWKLIPAHLTLEQIHLTFKQMPDLHWKLNELNYDINFSGASSFSIEGLLKLISLPSVEMKNIQLHILPHKKQFEMYLKLKKIQIAIDSKWQGMQLYADGAALTMPSQKEYLPDFTLMIKTYHVFDQAKIKKMILQNVYLSNKDFNLSVKGDIDFSSREITKSEEEKAQPVLNGSPDSSTKFDPIFAIDGNISFYDLRRIAKYLPESLFDPGLSEWLHHAFLSGEIKNGEIQWKGRISDFPYDQNTGLFKIHLPVNQVNLHFAPHWPLLLIDHADVTFINRALYISLASGKLQQIPFKSIQAWIPYLGDAQPQILEVRTPEPMTASFKDAIAYIQDSPLRDKIGKFFVNSQVDSVIQLNLNLTVPLKKPENLKVSGQIQLNQNRLAFPSWHVQLEKMVGQVSFTEKTVSAQNLQGFLFNEPTVLTIKTDEKNPDITRATLKNMVSITSLEKILNQSLSKFASGKSLIETTLEFSKNNPLKIILKSKLNGIAIHAKTFIDKPAASEREAMVIIQAHPKSDWVTQIKYADMLSAAFKLKLLDSEWKPYAIVLQFGKNTLPMPEGQGLSITGVLQEFDLAQLNSFISNHDDTQNNIPMEFDRIHVLIHQLKWGAQTFQNTQIQVDSKTNYWNIGVDGPAISGFIQVPTTILNHNNSNLITAQFDRLYLTRTNAAKPDALQFNQIPSIKLNIDQLRIDKEWLGKINLVANAEKDKLRIYQLQAQSPAMFFTAEGRWDAQGTFINGKVSSNNINQMLKQLAISLDNFDAKQGSAEFELFWKNSPLNLKLENAIGKLKLEIGNGRIINVDSSTGAKMDLGKLLNLFSLQSLPKRLSFDFSDVFQKGYLFDRVHGDFYLSQGQASTSNMRFHGSLANISVKGTIGFTKKNYNLILTVMPQVTASIPVAATLVTGQPLIGLGAWVANKVFSKGVSKATAYYYSVTGSWENPQWQTISAPQAAQATSNQKKG